MSTLLTTRMWRRRRSSQSSSCASGSSWIRYWGWSHQLYLINLSFLLGGFVNWHCWSVFSLFRFGPVPICPSENISEKGFLNPVQFFTQTNPDPGIRTLDSGSRIWNRLSTKIAKSQIWIRSGFGSVEILTESDPNPGGPKTSESGTGILPILWNRILFSPRFDRDPVFYDKIEKKQREKSKGEFYLKSTESNPLWENPALKTLKDFSNLFHCLGDLRYRSSEFVASVKCAYWTTTPIKGLNDTCSVAVPDPIGSVDLDSERQKWPTKKGNFLEIYCFEEEAP